MNHRDSLTAGPMASPVHQPEASIRMRNLLRSPEPASTEPSDLYGERLESFFASRPGRSVISAYLFGSHAAGRAHRESDVDVAVLLDWKRYPTSESRFEQRIKLGAELIAALHENDVDVVILNDAPPLFARAILHKGRRVFLGDADEDLAFTIAVRSRAADLEPWLRHMRALKLEALAR